MPEHIQDRGGYSFHLTNIDCLRGATSFNVIMELKGSVGPLMPYLAASLNGCSYVHGADEISLMDDGHIVVIYPERLTLTDVKDLREADALCEKYYRILRGVGERRDRIEPVYSKKNRTRVLDILQALPKTNCGACGDPSCVAFASRVYRREAALARCPSLPAESPAYVRLLALLRADGYAVPEDS